MRKVFLFLLAALTLTTAWLAGNTVITTGFGPDKREALMAAQREAVERSVGVLVDSQSRSKNMVLVEDHIFSKSRGYIKNYTVVSETEMADGNWKVVIECEAAEEKIINDLKSLGILRDKMGNPRIMIVYDEEFADGALADNPIVSEAYNGIVEYLTEREFSILSKKTHVRSPKLSQMQIKMPEKNEAEYVLVYSLKAVDGGDTNTFHKKWVMISTKIIDISSGRILANQSKKVMGVDKDSRDFALRKAGRKAGKLTAKLLERKIVKRWQGETVSGRTVIMELTNVRKFSLLMEFKAQLKKAFGVRNLVMKHSTLHTAEYEITYVGDTDTLKELAYKILKKLGLKPGNPVVSGDRVRINLTGRTP